MRLRRASDDGKLDREAALIGRARLLVIDELGFLPLDADGARLLFQVFAGAYERRSVVIATNLEFSRWRSVLGDDQMVAAVIARIVHHGRLVQFRASPTESATPSCRRGRCSKRLRRECVRSLLNFRCSFCSKAIDETYEVGDAALPGRTCEHLPYRPGEPLVASEVTSWTRQVPSRVQFPLRPSLLENPTLW